MTNRQRLGLFIGITATLGGAYYWYKNRKPQFKILEFNNQARTVKWQYGKITNIAKAGQNDTYSSSPDSDYFVNVDAIRNEKEVIGIRFNFLGKDNREPKFVYFN